MLEQLRESLRTLELKTQTEPTSSTETSVMDTLLDLKPQKQLTEEARSVALQATRDRLDDICKNQLIDEATRWEAHERRAAINAARSKDSGITLQMLPTQPQYSFTPGEWIDNMALRLNLPLPTCNLLPRICKCGYAMRGGRHLYDCKKAHVRYETHETLKAELGKAANIAGIKNRVEPRVHPDLKDKKRLDLELFNIPGDKTNPAPITIGIDVTTTNPLNVSAIQARPESKSQQSNLEASKAAKAKNEHYKEYKHTLIPYAFELTGGSAEENSSVLEIMKRYAETRGRPFSLKWIKANIAFAHRKTAIRTLHQARNDILRGCGILDASWEDMEGALAAPHHVNPCIGA
jgi:hypothetical protein